MDILKDLVKNAIKVLDYKNIILIRLSTDTLEKKLKGEHSHALSTTLNCL